MNRHALIVLVSLGLLLALVGCGDKKAEEKPAAQPQNEPPAEEKKNGLTKDQAEQPIAKVGETTITVGEFADRLASQSPYLRARYSSPERKREFLDNMVCFELLAIEAQKRGLDKQPEVDRVKRQMMV